MVNTESSRASAEWFWEKSLLMIHWDTAASRQRIHLCIRCAVRHQTHNKQALQGLQEALRGSVAQSVSAARPVDWSAVTARRASAPH